MKELLVNGCNVKVSDKDYKRAQSALLQVKCSGYRQYCYVKKDAEKRLTLAAFLLNTKRRIYYKDGNPLNNQRENLSFTQMVITRKHPTMKPVPEPPRKKVWYHPLEALMIGSEKDYGVPIVFQE